MQPGLARYLANDAPETSIERETYAALSAIDIPFRRQAFVAGYRVDAYLPARKIIIECQGDYWHCNPVAYPNGPETAAQHVNVERDAAKAKRLAALGYRVILLWERDIRAVGASALLKQALLN